MQGLDSGGGLDDETFAVYDKPWRTTEGVTQHLYRPGKNLDGDVYGEDLDKIIKTNRSLPSPESSVYVHGPERPRQAVLGTDSWRP